MRTPSWFPALLAALLALSAHAQTPSPDQVIEGLRAYRYGVDGGAAAAVDQWALSSASDPAKRAECARLLAAVLDGPASFDAKQLACRELALVGGPAEVPVLARLLPDAQLAHYALLALARIPGPESEVALLEALRLPDASVAASAATALGVRRSRQAVVPLGRLLSSSNLTLARAAADAMSRIPDPLSAGILYGNRARATGERRRVMDQAIAAWALSMPASNRLVPQLLAALDADKTDTPTRAAVLRGKARAGRPGADGPALLLPAFAEDGTARQRMAAELARLVQGPHAARRLAGWLPRLTPTGQALLLAALADRADPEATPAVLPMLGSADAQVHAAAVEALAAMGGAGAVPALLRAAAGKNEEERAIARAGLATMRGRSVDASLTAALVSGNEAIASEAAAALGQRGSRAALPRLMALARSGRGAACRTAISVLAEIGGVQQGEALLDLMLSRPAEERDVLMGAVTAIFRKTPREGESAVITRRIATAAKPEDRADLLTLLAQVAGDEALPALKQAAFGSDEIVQVAAVRQLAEWPTDAPMPTLLALVKELNAARVRTLALRGYLRLIAVDEARSPDESVALYRDVAEAAQSVAEKRIVLTGLTHLRCLAALEYAGQLRRDPGVASEANAALLEIGAATIGAYPEQTRQALLPLSEGPDPEAARRARDILAVPDRLGGYIGAWQVSPAYARQGAVWSDLFDIPFAPEQTGSAVSWSLLPVGTSAEQPWLLDLLPLMAGEQRAAYLRTVVRSPASRDVVLELGSDDGVKAWLNGEVVASQNVQRAVAPGQVKAAVQLKQGINLLMLKITQNNSGWSACARFANPDGSPVTDLTYTVPDVSPPR